MIYYLNKLGAISECTLANACDAIRDGYAGKTGAIIKRVRTDYFANASFFKFNAYEFNSK